MKTSVSSRILAILLVICMVLSVMPMAFAEETSDNVEILFLDTSDIHGQLYATDYTADVSQSGAYRQGWTRVATYIKEQRAAYDNVFLSDSGDTIQGTPLTYYYAFEEDTLEDPTVKVMRSLDYDLWVVGNHEFNYGMNILTEQLDYLDSAPTEGEDTVAMSAANYLDAATNSDESKDWATWRGYEPYLIKEYEGVKVAIMGMGNPNIPKWDVPENWAGIYFANPIETYLHYEEEMKAAADVIVLVSHSGIDSDAESDYVRALIEQTDSIDLAFTGHEHRNGVFEITNAAGEVTPVIAPSTKCAVVGRALIEVDPETKEIVTIDAAAVPMVENKEPVYEVDAELEAILAPYEEATWNDYMLQSIGTATGDFPAANLGSAPSAFMDLINKVQLYYAYDYNGENTTDDPSDDVQAQLSISAPLTSGDAANLIPAGEIVLGDMFRLYRYENWFYQITMSGKEVRTWLEFAATKINDQGEVVGYDLTYYDVIYGEGFSYVIDYFQPEGSRVVSMTYNGEEVADDATFTVVLNNYRYNGGGNYVQYLNDHGCEFIANDPDRVIYSTQYDMIQGEDQGQARNMLANYISLMGQIDPDITSTWQVMSSEPEADFTFGVVTTTDMHGRSTASDVATQATDNNSMVKAATIIKEQREIFGENMILIDNGDTIQGSLVAQYAVNFKPEEVNPMIEAMLALDYDVWVMGNHEFNFTPQQRDQQTVYAMDGGISVLSGNIVVKEDGKDVHGNDVTSGSPFYDPYVIKILEDGNGNQVRVGVIGLSNAANHTWDLETNYPNMQFSSLENEDGSLAYEINKWSSYLVENDLADIIIVSAHSGKGTDDGLEGFSLESQALEGAAGSKDVAMLISGHDHTADISTVTNADGETVYMVNAGGSSVSTSTFYVNFAEDGSIESFEVLSQNIPLADAAEDEEIAELTQSWYDDTYAWASAPLGVFDGGWTDVKAEADGKTNIELVTAQTSLLDFVHKGQIWASWQNYESDGIEGATVSIGSAVFAETTWNGPISFVPEDGTTISTLELSMLYRYSNNLLCAIDMTPQQLWNWMNTVADKYDIAEDGSIVLNDSIYGVDTFYGVDYTMDLTKPYGERLVYAAIDGVDLLDLTEPIRCTLNSYRLSGGYGFYEATGLTEAECCWTASQYLGADRAPVSTQLGEYVAAMGTITPYDAVSHGYDSAWELSTEPVDVVTNPYTDVSESFYAYEPIQVLTEAGIIEGVGDGLYDPFGTLTRAQWVTMLYRAAGEPEVTEPSTFTDVPTDQWYSDAVAWAQDCGIVNGVTETLMAPNDPVTREQMVTILYRLDGEEAVECDLSAFTDEQTIEDYALAATKWAVAKGYINGIPTDDGVKLAARETTDRAQTATFFYRYLTSLT